MRFVSSRTEPRVTDQGVPNHSEIKERANEATEGPWCRYDHAGPWVVYQADGRGDCPIADQIVATTDAEFIAHAREDIPALLGVIEELVEGLRAVTDELDRHGFGDFHYGPMPREQSVVEHVGLGRVVDREVRDETMSASMIELAGRRFPVVGLICPQENGPERSEWAYPGWINYDDLQDRAEISRAGGSWGTYLSRLRSNELIEEHGDSVRASPNLFMEAMH